MAMVLALDQHAKAPRLQEFPLDRVQLSGSSKDQLRDLLERHWTAVLHLTARPTVQQPGDGGEPLKCKVESPPRRQIVGSYLNI